MKGQQSKGRHLEIFSGAEGSAARVTFAAPCLEFRQEEEDRFFRLQHLSDSGEGTMDTLSWCASMCLPLCRTHTVSVQVYSCFYLLLKAHHNFCYFYGFRYVAVSDDGSQQVNGVRNIKVGA
jgi:hypothetical protein